jgi:hypothetical protein
VLVAVAAAPARGVNPKVSLKVENATFAEAAAALSRASGVAVWLMPQPPRPGQPPPAQPPGLDEKASFDWTNTTFARALRQLCERYHLRPWYLGAQGYGLGQRFGDPPRLPVLAGPVEKVGVRLFVSAAQFGRGPGTGARRGEITINLTFRCELGERDAESMAYVRNLRGQDDRGNGLIEQSYSAWDPGGYPDEWSITRGFGGLHPQAKRLAWVEGELTAHRTYERIALEVPLPASGQTSRAEMRGIVAEVLSYTPAAPGADPERLGPRVKSRVTVPKSLGLQLAEGSETPVLVAASGKTFESEGGGGGEFHNDKESRYGSDLPFKPLPEEPVRVLFYLLLKSPPETLFNFRLTNIPLPGPVPPGPDAPAAPPRFPAPYTLVGGGTLVSAVRIGDRPAGAGTLSLGLAAKEGARWATLRWLEVEVGGDGVAKIPDLRPGTYLVRRSFRPASGGAALGPGHWTGDRVEITVVAGKEAVLPPLGWVKEPAR